eukprot:6973252-Alexandrium_andersonii.AAC.1
MARARPPHQDDQAHQDHYHGLQHHVQQHVHQLVLNDRHVYVHLLIRMHGAGHDQAEPHED